MIRRFVVAARYRRQSALERECGQYKESSRTGSGISGAA